MCANLYIFTIYHYSRDAYQYIKLLSIYSKQFSGFNLILNNANMQKKKYFFLIKKKTEQKRIKPNPKIIIQEMLIRAALISVYSTAFYIF